MATLSKRSARAIRRPKKEKLMTGIDDAAVTRRARGQIARRRGAMIGLILIVLGAWGALIPFLGPYFHYAYTPDHAWRWTASRGWLEVLPGAVTVLGGLLVLISNSRATAVLGAWLAAAGGAWFAVGTSFEPLLHTGAVGAPAGGHTPLRVLEAIGFFYGLGVVIVFFAATASGRLSVRSLADIHVARRELDDEARARIRASDAEAARAEAPAGDESVTRRPAHDADPVRQPSPAAGRAPRSDTAASITADPLGEQRRDDGRHIGDGATAVSDTDLPGESHPGRWNPLHRND
jgi:hypothetical protein